MTDQKRLTWLDGLKGLACLGVFTHHFALRFYNAVYFGKESPSLLHGFDTWLAASPAGVFINGNFWVCLFILITAFLAARQVILAQDDSFRGSIARMLLKRYPRLMPQAFTAAVINYLLIRLMDLWHCNYTDKVLTYGIGGLFYHGLIGTWIRPDSDLVGPFWTLHYFLFGFYAAVLLAVLSAQKTRFIPLLYLACLFPAFMIDVYYVPVVLGVLLADLSAYRRFQKADRAFAQICFPVVLILLGLFCGGYPSYIQPDNVYRVFSLPAKLTSFPILSHACGAFFLLAGLLLLFSGRKSVFLAGGPCRALGKISYSVYLLHILWIEYLGSVLMEKFTEICGSRALAGLPVYLILLVLLLLSSAVFERVTGRISGKLSEAVLRVMRTG